MDWRLLLDGLTSAIADILFIYSVLQIIIPCLSEFGINIFHNESIWSSLWFHQVPEEQNNQNNETLDFVLKDIFVENIVHISVDIVDVNWHWLSILLILESFFILSLLYGFIDMATTFSPVSPNIIGLSSAFF